MALEPRIMRYTKTMADGSVKIYEYERERKSEYPHRPKSRSSKKTIIEFINTLNKEELIKFADLVDIFAMARNQQTD